MMLDVYSDAWRDIYQGIADDFFARHPLASMSGKEMGAYLRTLGIIVRKDTDGRWEWIDVLNPEHLTELYLRWVG
jgi:hypothetical protein